MYHSLGPTRIKACLHCRVIFKTDAVIGIARKGEESGQSRTLELNIEVVIEIVQPDNLVASQKQPLSYGRSNEARCTGDQHPH